MVDKLSISKNIAAMKNLKIKNQKVYLDNCDFEMKQQLIYMFNEIPFIDFIENIEKALELDNVNVLSFIAMDFNKFPDAHESNRIGRVLLNKGSKYFSLLIGDTPSSFLPLWSCDITHSRIKNIDLYLSKYRDPLFEEEAHKLFVVILNLITEGKLNRELQKEGYSIFNYRDYLETLTSTHVEKYQINQRLVYVSFNPNEKEHTHYANEIMKELVLRGYQVVSSLDMCSSEQPHLYSARNLISASHVCMLGSKTSKKLRAGQNFLSYEYGLIFHRRVFFDVRILAYSMNDDYKKNFPYSIYSAISSDEIACLNLEKAKIKSMPVELKDSINSTQKNIIKGYFQFLFDELTETSCFQAIKILELIERGILLPADKQFLTEKNMLATIEQARNLIIHPRPHCRYQGDGSAYWAKVLKGQNPTNEKQRESCQSGVIDGLVYYHENGFGSHIFRERQGLLGLTSRNDNTAPTLTKAAVVNYIYELVNDEKDVYRHKAAQHIQFWYKRTRDENKALEAIKDKETQSKYKTFIKEEKNTSQCGNW